MSVLDRSFTAVRNLTAFAAAGLLALGALGAMPASAATGASGETDGGGVQVLDHQKTDPTQRIGAREVASAAADPCAELTPTKSVPGGEAEGLGAGTLHVTSCAAAGLPGSMIVVTGEGFASRENGGVVSYKLDDGKNPEAVFSPEGQSSGDVDNSGTLTVRASETTSGIPGDDGTFSIALRLPENLKVGGVYWVRVLAGTEDGLGQLSKWAKFRVAAPGKPQLSLDKQDVAFNEEFAVSGLGFDGAVGTDARISLLDSDKKPVDATVTVKSGTVSADGSLMPRVRIDGPSDTVQPGSYYLKADAGGISATTESAFNLAEASAPAFNSRNNTIDVTVPHGGGTKITLDGPAVGVPTPDFKWEWKPARTTEFRAFEQGGSSSAVEVVVSAQNDGDVYRLVATNAFGATSDGAARTHAAETSWTVRVNEIQSQPTSSEVNEAHWNCAREEYAADKSVRYCVTKRVPSGGNLYMEGIGWKAGGPKGSVLAVKFDNGEWSAAKPGTSPTGFGGGTADNVFQYIEASDAGSWRSDIPIPNAVNTTNFDAAKWGQDTWHEATILTGSSRAPGDHDVTRTVRVQFQIGDPQVATSGGPTGSTSENVIVVPSGTTGGSNFTLKASNSNLVSVQDALASQRPLITPAAPVLAEDDLTDLNRGDVEVEQDGTVLTTTFNSLEPGDWVYLHAWPGPQGVDWLQLDAEKKVRFDIVDLEPGDHKFSFVGQQGELVGWVDGNLPGESSRKSFENTKPVAGLVTPTNWNGPLLIAAFGTLALGLAATTILGIARSRRSA